MYRSAYQKAVLAHCGTLKSLPGYNNFRDPRPANLKNQCLLALDNWANDVDLQLLERIFGSKANKAAYIAYIRRSATGKFKAARDLLEDPEREATEQTFELLAVLSNFKHRPSSAFITNNVPKPETEPGKMVQEKPDDTTTADEEISDLPPNDNGDGIKHDRRLYVAVLIIFALFVLGAFMIDITPRSCMVWAKDHYQPVSCDSKFDDVATIGLDTALLKHFKKIPNAEVTMKYFGTAWYLKKDNKVDFFTSRGNGRHPVFTTRNLAKATQHMIEKWGAESIR